jgi:hypothetical protein
MDATPSGTVNITEPSRVSDRVPSFTAIVLNPAAVEISHTTFGRPSRLTAGIGDDKEPSALVSRTSSSTRDPA